MRVSVPMIMLVPMLVSMIMLVVVMLFMFHQVRIPLVLECLHAP